VRLSSLDYFNIIIFLPLWFNFGYKKKYRLNLRDHLHDLLASL